MTTDELRSKYINFFKSSPRNHKEISPAPLVLENDPTTLFNSSGMQQLVPYLKGESHPAGRRLVNSQPSIRTQDIEEVGDGRHTTYFEMLGNWSLGSYFKKEQLSWFWEFLTGELGLPAERLWVSVFEGSSNIPRDDESFEIWRKLGVPEDRIYFYGVEKNWWSRSGLPDNMPVGEIGGPDSEVFFEFTGVKRDRRHGEKCHPNCDCGRFFEIGNSVFIEYTKNEAGGFDELPQKNVDFGGGLERLVAAVADKPDLFKTDVFAPWIADIERVSGKSYEGRERDFQIIADHMRGAQAIIKEGVRPGNKQQGYILRRLIRRSAVKMRSLKGGLGEGDLGFFDSNGVIEREVFQFGKTLERAVKLVGKISPFNLFQSYGFPVEVIQELYGERGLYFNKKQFEDDLKLHREKSRAASAVRFKGGLADSSAETTKLHTATHLLHESLRRVLGEHVRQKGSNITSARLRFDFTHNEKLSDREIEKIETVINEQIDKGLPVKVEIMTLEKAKKAGALAFFADKYDEKVKVYSIGEFSCEACGGPHVKSLSEIKGHVKITKQGRAGAGIRRVYAVIQKTANE